MTMWKKFAAILTTFALVTILIASCSPSPSITPPAVKPGDYNQSMNAGGRTRSYILHVPPSYDGKQAMPLVVVLHGAGGDAQRMVNSTGMNDKSDEAGFIVVYPNGTGPLNDEVLLTWNCGFCCGYALDNKVDDVGFIRSLIEKLEGELNIDKAGIYITGMSNGAMMTYRLGCELADIIAAIAPVSGSMGDWEAASDSPVAVIIFHGKADLIVPFDGGDSILPASMFNGVFKPESYAVNFWVAHDGCSTTFTRETDGNLVKDTYRGGRNGSEVVLCAITGAGHVWPGTDTITQQISATDLMWDFFAAHPKR